ncbi:hypothetical protein ACFWAY_49045 [Rhodococcus sp. NPDC059968]|uniref:hypothetical protein n=1 Tax=Rhodococcus sp. NPDC059968 TaxID=3347017 RepID=UPI00366B2EE8
MLYGVRQTGASIKEAAIGQGVPIQTDFLLSRKDGPKFKPVGDDEHIRARNDDEFRATTTRDHDDDHRGHRGSDRGAPADVRVRPVTVRQRRAGGAWVTIDPIQLGPVYEQETSWIAFQITFPYPEADVYPLFVRADVRRRDGAGHGGGFQSVTWGPRGEPGTQLSRRGNRLNPAIDTATTKVLKVLKWLSEQ